MEEDLLPEHSNLELPQEGEKREGEVGELKHELHWHTQYIKSTTDEKCKAPPMIEEAESEEEILFGPGAAPGGQ